jgi:hypothetical protein
MEGMVPPDAPIKSPDVLQGKTVEIDPWRVEPFPTVHGLTFVNGELSDFA